MRRWLIKLWVRSQDKMKLIKINNACITFGDNTRDYAIVYDEPNGIEVLGIYKTKQRALEVLDEIQKKINLINLGHDCGSPMVDLKNPSYIYEMPKE